MLDYSQIRAILPQGYPMVLVDRVVSLDPGVSIVGIKAITGSEPCYRNLGDNLKRERYAYPTSLLVESFGQTAAILWLQSDKSGKQHPDQVLVFVAARNIRIEGHAYPGDVLRHVARLDRVVSDTVFVEGEVWLNDRRIASIGSMIAALRDRSVLMKQAISTDVGQGAPVG
jgi:3-hydroxyacyl-[acyl-carrier-protein] dehydratase